MSRIEKLSILGVRSFGNKTTETIQFHAPLTLIVGWNGSGKTTIIECLKYATTGELPPNSKTGGAFIHDPKLANEKEVLAMVRISFKSTSDTRYVATRRLQLSVKKTTRSQKTLDGSLQIYRDGEKTSVSTRVAELDTLIPQYLGVSKAVLEYVIFCHQDDSLWPMSEPAALKKRFDEIFEALKYTKAIDNIKVLRKKQNEELGKLKLIESYAKDDKEKGDRCERRSTQLFDEIETLRAEVTSIEGQIEAAEAKASEAFTHASRFEQIVAQLNSKRITLQANRESAAELEQSIKKMAEGDEELQSMLDQYEERVLVYERQQEELRRQYTELKHELDSNRAALGSKQGDIGKFQAEKEQHDRQLQKRESLIKEAAKRHGIRGFDYEIGDDQVREFLGIIGKMSKDQDRAVNRALQEAQEELRKAQNAINQLNDRKSGLVQRKENCRSQIAANERRISDLQRTMNQIRIDEGREATLQEKKAETEQKLKTATADMNTQRYDARIQEADSEVRRLDERRERLDLELTDASKLARETAQIEYTQDELKTAKHGLRTMSEVHGSRIAKLVDPDWEISSLESAFKRIASEKASQLKEAESKRDIAIAALNKINFKMGTLESDQKKKQTQLEGYEKTVRDATQEDDIADFDKTLQDLEEEYEFASSDNAKLEANIEYMEQCLETAIEDNECRLCQRAFHDSARDPPAKTKAGLIARLQKIIDQAQRKIKGQGNADEVFAKLQTVRDAKPSHALALRLRESELPALQSELANTMSERDAINRQLEQHDASIDELKSSKEDVDSISKDVQSLVNYHNQVEDLERKIRDMTEKQQSLGSSRGMDAVQEDVNKVRDESRTAKTALNRLTADRDKLRNTINALELEIRDINAELNLAQSKLKEKRDLSERIDDFKSQNNEQRDAIRTMDGELQDLLPKIDQAQAKYDDINRRGNETVQRLQTEASKLSDSVRQLSDAEQDINAYISKGGPRQLEQAHQEITALEDDIGRIEKDMMQVTRQLKKIEDTVRDTDATKRCISDNIRYRKAKRSLQTLQYEIDELESQNAEEDKARYEREGKHWQHEWTKLSTERADKHGTLKSLDNQLKELLEEWETDYKDAAFKYREAHIKVETTKAAVEDLGRYGGALDKAIMKYHTLKMDEINGLIEEIWRHAYQGTDVDTIKIRSDNETAKGNRSYNYRVVMVKGDAEMDMRGRCSAGQKVLASIVIRLALAECFGKNCGLIALDEPTTNLDQQNIEGLAASLAGIIESRRKQANFQLIVITHDEAFLRSMNCSKFTDVYWRVGRNEDQQSIIERQNISEVNK